MRINIPHLSVMGSFLESIVEVPDMEYAAFDVKRFDILLLVLIREIRNPRVFLKANIQGYDLEVLNGASECIDKILGIFSEISIQPLYKNQPHYLRMKTLVLNYPI